MAAVADQLIALDDHVSSGSANEIGSFVNNGNSCQLEALLELVNNGDGLDQNLGPQLEHVDNDRESPKKIMTYFADDDNDID